MTVTYPTSAVIFEWDDEKEIINKKKHSISFEDAIAVFYDEHPFRKYDEDHSDDEHRTFLIGRLRGHLLAVVIYTERYDRIRIISARLASKHEVRKYELRQIRD